MSTQTVSQAVATRDEQVGPIKFMWSKRAHFGAVLPASVDVEAFLGTAAGALYSSDVPGKNLTLMKCARENPDSLFVALMECAALGHRPGTDEYYLTPRMDHGRPKVLGIEGYRGVIERMYRSGAVANVVVREVCENDYFDYREGEMDVPVHRFGGDGAPTGGAFFGGMGKRGEMVGGYAYAKLTNGSYSRVVILTRDDVLAARDSGGYKATDPYSPWNRLDGGEQHPEYKGRSMWWKTFAKRLEPWVPTSSEYRREQLRASAAAVSAGPRPATELPGPPDDVVDAEIVDDPPAPGPEAPRLEQPSGRRARSRHQDEPGPAASGASSSAGGPASASPTQTGRQSPSSGNGSASTRDPRDEVRAQLGLYGYEGIAVAEYAGQLLDVNASADLSSLDARQCAEVLRRLDGVGTRAEAELLLRGGEVPGE